MDGFRSRRHGARWYIHGCAPANRVTSNCVFDVGRNVIMMLYAWSDGASRGNPGFAACGAICKHPDGKVVNFGGTYLGTETNNYAEHKAAQLAMNLALDGGADELVLNMDSRLVRNQLAGEWAVRDQRMLMLVEEARELEARFRTVKYVWVPRGRNEEADWLANQALDGRPIELPPMTASPVTVRYGTPKDIPENKGKVDRGHASLELARKHRLSDSPRVVAIALRSIASGELERIWGSVPDADVLASALQVN